MSHTKKLISYTSLQYNMFFMNVSSIYIECEFVFKEFKASNLFNKSILI